MDRYEVSIKSIFPFSVSAIVEADNRLDAEAKGYKELCELVGMPVLPSMLCVRKIKNEQSQN